MTRILVRDTIASWWRISTLPESRDWWLHDRHYSVIENMCVSLYTRLPGWQDSFFKKIISSIQLNYFQFMPFVSFLVVWKLGFMKMYVRYVIQCMDITFIFWFLWKMFYYWGFLGGPNQSVGSSFKRNTLYTKKKKIKSDEYLNLIVGPMNIHYLA